MLPNRGLRNGPAMLDHFHSRGALVALTAALLVACGLSPLQARAALLLGADGVTVYDTANNISWLANANLAATNRFGLPICIDAGSPVTPCVNPSGSMRYQSAAAWVAAMNAANYLGHSNWQIPTSPIVDPSCSFVGPQMNSFGWGCSASAFGSLYNALGLRAPNTAAPAATITVGPFSNFQPDLYWTQTSLPQPTGDVGCCATISFNSGWQGSNIASNFLFLLPMIQGKIAGAPPASGTGLQVNPGGQTVYDPIANVTWLANANLAASNTFGLPPCNAPGSPKLCVSSNGAMNWDSADQLIKNMNAASYLGQSNWQMPTADPACAASYVCSMTNAPFQSLYYTQLGLAAGTPVVMAPAIAVGPFTGIRPYLYWTCQGDDVAEPCRSALPAPGFEWSFWFSNGFQGTDVFAHDMYVTAYYPGPATAFPPNYQGLWWAAPGGSEAGWGINFAHQGDTIFASWFTYDPTGKGTWLVMTATKIAPNTYSGALLQGTGPAFDAVPFPPLGSPGGATVSGLGGTGTITFSDANNGTFAYTLGDVAQTKAITRELIGPQPTCLFGALADLRLATNYTDLWWAAPAGSEAGWGINLTHEGDTIFATWYTFDLDHTPMWLVVTASKTAPGVYAGTPVYRLTGPPFNTTPFPPLGSPGGATGVSMGSASFAFSDGNTATFNYTVNGVTQSKTITREVFTSPGTVCQ
jgi:hypothetical protein